MDPSRELPPVSHQTLSDSPSSPQGLISPHFLPAFANAPLTYFNAGCLLQSLLQELLCRSSRKTQYMYAKSRWLVGAEKDWISVSMPTVALGAAAGFCTDRACHTATTSH